MALYLGASLALETRFTDWSTQVVIPRPADSEEVTTQQPGASET